MGGDVVDELVRVLEHRVLPRAERGHRPAGAAARDELQARVQLAHPARHLGRQSSVLVGRLVAELPRTVHLVAQAPHTDPVRLACAVGHAQVRQVGPARVVGVLQQVQRLLKAPGAEVDRHHRLHARGSGPRHELVETERVALDGPPRRVQSGRPVRERADAVLPPVTGHEVAARVAHDRHAELAHQVQDVAAEPRRIDGRVPWLVDARVDAPAHVLDERAEGPWPDGRDHQSGVEADVRAVRRSFLLRRREIPGRAGGTLTRAPPA